MVLEEVLVKGFVIEFYIIVEDDFYFIWFFWMVYIMVRDILDLVIFYFNFFCREFFSMVIFNEVIYES